MLTTLLNGLSLASVLALVAIGLAIIFGLFGVLVFWMGLDAWLGRSVVEADRDGLRIRKGMLGIGPLHRFAIDDIKELGSDGYMSSGTRVWKVLFVVPHRGRKRTLAKGICSRSVERAVLDELNAALGKFQQRN
jgi:hypothetical protein